MELRTARGTLTQNLWVAREGVAAPVIVRLSLTCRSAEDDLSDASRTYISKV